MRKQKTLLSLPLYTPTTHILDWELSIQQHLNNYIIIYSLDNIIVTKNSLFFCDCSSVHRRTYKIEFEDVSTFELDNINNYK